MNYDIDYRTEYRYDAPVFDQHNALRIKPAQMPTQRVGRFDLVVEPSARLHAHIDYFGTEVIEFNLAERHERLAVRARARVMADEPPAPAEAGWDGLATPEYLGRAGEFLLVNGHAPPRGMFDDVAGMVAGDSPLAAVLAVCDAIPDRFEYRPGATYVRSTIEDLLRGGAGVCQDFAHLALLLLRRRGIATRYVSGYLFAAPADGGDDSVEVDTHAWLEALVPAAEGGVWVGADPTNRGLTGERHVKIGHGRDYSDVPPIKGVYRGEAEAEHDVKVRMTRVDPAAEAPPASTP